jgi:hypothetical protein
MEITGFKRFKGTVDGSAIDSAKVFVRIKLDDSRNSADQRAGGFCTEELRVDPAILKRIEHNPMPLLCDVETERVSNGKAARDVVVDIRPVEAVAVVPSTQRKAA